jgi:multiple sugar transport system permease protein
MFSCLIKDTMARSHAISYRAKGSFKRRRFVQLDAFYGYLFVAPQVLGFLVFVVGPLIAVFVYSFQARNLLTGQTTFVGIENYQDAFFNNPLFWKVLANSLIFTAGLVPLNVGLALLLAVLLGRALPGTTLFRTLFFAPVVTSSVAWAIMWRFMLQGEQGTINQFLALLGLTGPNWLREPAWAMVAVIVTRVLKNVGLNMLIYLAALQTIPRAYKEAARIDGANSWQVFARVTLPLLAPTTLVVTVLTVIGSLKVFDHILLLTGGGPANATLVLVYYIYQQAFEFFETGYASALAVLLFAVSLALTLIQWFMRQERSGAVS